MKITADQILKDKFSKYIDLAIQKCKRMSFQEKSDGIWTKPEVVKYLANLPTEEAHVRISKTISQILNTKGLRKILVIGGGTGKLGHHILKFSKKWLVTEIDSSKEMVSMANNNAKKLELGKRFLSVVADAQKIPFKDASFDFVVAYGVFRYFLSKDQKTIIDEMKRVSSRHILIAEGKAKDVIYDLNKNYCRDFKLIETSIKMFRVSLFYMFFAMYESDKEFKKLIDLENKFEPVDVLSKIAGVSEGILYELII